jgi:hypothetical protein
MAQSVPSLLDRVYVVSSDEVGQILRNVRKGNIELDILEKSL